MTPSRPAHNGVGGRHGMTLVEMLVATAATMIVMGAVAVMFAEFARGVGNGRAVMDLNARLRTTALLLRRDLDGVTAPLLPPLSPAAGAGYFEYIEGPRQDRDAADGSAELRADTDDVLLFTTAGVERRLVGTFDDGILNAGTAEVAWFLRPTVPATVPPTCTLYRRQLLVVGRLGTAELGRILARFRTGGLAAVYDRFDVSLAPVGSGSAARLVPNTLADLTCRERRFFHGPLDPAVAGGFPFPFIADHQIPSLSTSTETLPPSARGLVFDSTSHRQGEDVLLTGVIAFDVRVFDPAAPVALGGGDGLTAVTPGDAVEIGGGIANGCYVDLGNGVHGRAASLPETQGPRFAGYGHPLSGGLVGSATTRRTYDTWTTHYESNGIDEDSAAGPDQATNGLDDDVPPRSGALTGHPADGVADDSGELETSPPYPFPVRGIEIRIRCYEPEARQVRQVTVRHCFVPH